MSVDATPVLVAALTGIPSAFAAYWAARSKGFAKSAATIGQSNSGKLNDLANGTMDTKIENAIKKVLEDRPNLVTEANIADVLNRILNERLE